MCSSLFLTSVSFTSISLSLRSANMFGMTDTTGNTTLELVKMSDEEEDLIFRMYRLVGQR